MFECNLKTLIAFQQGDLCHTNTMIVGTDISSAVSGSVYSFMRERDSQYNLKKLPVYVNRIEGVVHVEGISCAAINRT